MREILVYDDYEIHKLGAGGGTQYEEVTTEKATSIYVTDVAKTKGKLLPFGRTTQNDRILPEGYTQLDYIESNGNQYINTITTNINKVLKFETEIKWDNDITTRQNMGGDFGQFFGIQNGKYQIGTNIISNATPSVNSFDKLIGIFDAPNSSHSITINGNLYSYARNSWQNEPFNLFRIGPGVSSYYCKCKLKYFKIYTNNELIRHYIPCKNSNNEAGLYDLITKSFYASEGTASFIAGNEVSVPNPDYPQEIENVEGRECRNLINLPSELSITGYKRFDVSLPAGEYILSCGDVVKGGSVNPAIVGLGNWFILSSNTNKTIKLEEDISNIIIYSNGYDASGSANVTSVINNLMIRKVDEINNTYEPYFEGKRLEFNVCNKQLFDKNNANILNTAIDANGLGNNSPTTYRTVYIPCKPNTTYTVSKLFDQTKNRFTVAYTKETPNYSVQTYGIIYNSTGYTTTITTGVDAKYLVAYVWLNGGSTTPEEMINSIQIEEGNTATPYEEHKEQMIPFPLAEGQKLMEGDYLADDGVHHVKNKMIFDGTENWVNYTGSYDGRFYCTTKHFGAVAEFEAPAKFKCTHFTPSASTNTINGISSTKYATYINAGIEEVTDLATFKNWLANNNILVEYTLPTETIDTYTPAQAEAYNKLINLMLYKGVNHIWTETDGLEPNLQLTYKRKKQSNVLQVSNVQPLNNLELNNTEETPEEITTEISEE